MLLFISRDNLPGLLRLPNEVLIILFPVLLLSLTIHEFAHARIALAFGDPTALRQGRVTLNPIKHLDPMGTIALLIMGFGWAKPVPVNPYLLRPPKLGDICVSIGGPLSNLMLAVIAGGLYKILIATGFFETSTKLTLAIAMALQFAVSINIVLFTFNLIPLFPLDGHHILRELLPRHMQENFMRFQLQYGQMLLMAMLILPTMMPGIPDILGSLLTFIRTKLLILIF